MTFKQMSARYLEPISMWTMVVGIVVLCQPVSLTLHTYGVTIILAGLVGFTIFSHFQPGPQEG
jgi:ABC-type transporter Mla maintaining outer membrane lipid asymmetry permease subunit MlaE